MTITVKRRTEQSIGPAMRQQAARLRDGRLLGGIVLVVLATLMGAWLLGGDDDTVSVLRTTRDLSVGAVLADTEVISVPRAMATDAYLGPSDDVAGTVNRPIRAGELIPRVALVPPGRLVTREVTVPVDPLHAPPGLQPGAAVDVWASASGSSPMPPRLVLADVVVTAVAADQSALSGELGVVLDVPEQQVGALVAATRGGDLDLIAVPLSGQRSTTAAVPPVAASTP